MIRRRRHLVVTSIAAASLVVLSGCASAGRPTAARSSLLPPTVATSDLLLTTADLPVGFEQFTQHVKSRSFCGHTSRVSPTAEARADFAMPTSISLYEIRDIIATYSSAKEAQNHLDEVRAFLMKSCHLDVTSRGRDAISIVPTPPFGTDSLGVRQEITEIPPVDPLRFSSMVGCSYYVRSGSSIIDVGVINAPLLGPAGTEILLPTPDLELLKRLTLLQLKRFKSKTPSPGMSA